MENVPVNLLGCNLLQTTYNGRSFVGFSQLLLFSTYSNYTTLIAHKFAHPQTPHPLHQGSSCGLSWTWRTKSWQKINVVTPLPSNPPHPDPPPPLSYSCCFYDLLTILCQPPQTCYCIVWLSHCCCMVGEFELEKIKNSGRIPS